MLKKLILAAFLCALASVRAQVPTQPYWNPKVSFVNSSGLACAGCSLYTFAAGTTTPQATYTKAGGTVSNTNPIILDASGTATVWLGSSNYKFMLIDTNSATVWTVDNVNVFTVALGCTASEVTVFGASNALGCFGDFTYLDAATNSAAPGLDLSGPGSTVQAASIPISLLSFATIANPIDPTGAVDSTNGIQAALNTVCNQTAGYTLSVPRGTYKVSATLKCAGALEPHIVGEGRGNTRFAATTALGATGGSPILQVSNSYHPYLKGFSMTGQCSAPPSMGIEMRITAPLTGGGWLNNSATIEDVAIAPALPSGASDCITDGIVFDHDAGGSSSYCDLINGIYTCDVNNDQAMLRFNDVTPTRYAYTFIGGNSEGHNIIGGHMGGWDCIHNVGGSYTLIGGFSSCVNVINHVQDTNTNDFPYLKPSAVIGHSNEGCHSFARTDPVGVFREFQAVAVDLACGPRNINSVVSTAGTAVTWISGSTWGALLPGDYVYIGTTAYQISVVNSTTSLTLSVTAGTNASIALVQNLGIDWESQSETGATADFSLDGREISMGSGGSFKFTDPTSTVAISHLRSTPTSIIFANSLSIDGMNIPTNGFTGFTYTGTATQDLCVKNTIINAVTQPTQCTNLQISNGLFGYGSFSNLLKDSDWQAGNPSGGSNTLWANFGTTSGSSTTAGASTDIFSGSNAMTITAGTLAVNGFYGVLSSTTNEISVTAGQTVTARIYAKGTAGQNLFLAVHGTDPSCQGLAPNAGQLIVTLGTVFPSAPYTVSCTFSTTTTAQLFVGTETSAGTITVSHAEMTTASGYQLPVITTGATLAGTGFVKNGVVQGINGIATLASGTVTVTTPFACTPGSTCSYKLSNCGKNASTAIGVPTLGTVTAGTSFVINSESAVAAVVTGDLSSACWQIN